MLKKSCSRFKCNKNNKLCNHLKTFLIQTRCGKIVGMMALGFVLLKIWQ